MMNSALRGFTQLLKYGTLASTVAFAACVLLQIFARLALPAAPSWTEEAARLFFVLAVGFAAGLAMRSGDYVQFDFVYSSLSPVWQRRVSLATGVLTVGLFALFTVAAVRFAAMGLVERSPTLGFPMAVAFGAMVVLGVGVGVFALRWVLTKVSPL